jgi:hypothetical protein
VASALLQAALALVQLDQFDLGAGQFAVGAQHVVAALGAALAGVGHGGASSSTS